MRLTGKTVLVTGAAKRVGRVIAMSLARRGAKVAVHYNRSRAEAQRLVREIEEGCATEAAAFQADLSDPRQAARLAGAVLKRFGALHALVNSASVYERTPFGKVGRAQWDRHLDANLRAPFFLSQAAGAIMRRAGQGKIVNIADWAAQRPYADFIPYCVSKAGLVCLNTALAKALAPQVQVNALLPGPVLLPESYTPRMRRAVREATLVKRLGSPEDLARAVLFLIEEDFVTGAALAVDGGRGIA